MTRSISYFLPIQISLMFSGLMLNISSGFSFQLLILKPLLFSFIFKTPLIPYSYPLGYLTFLFFVSAYISQSSGTSFCILALKSSGTSDANRGRLVPFTRFALYLLSIVSPTSSSLLSPLDCSYYLPLQNSVCFQNSLKKSRGTVIDISESLQ